MVVLLQSATAERILIRIKSDILVNYKKYVRTQLAWLQCFPFEQIIDRGSQMAARRPNPTRRQISLGP